MVKVGTAEYDVVLSRSKLQSELSATSATLESGLGASSAKVEAEFTRSFQRIAKAGALIGAGIITKQSISAASDLAEQQQKVNVVFGDSAGVIHKFADTSSESFGISRREAETTAGTFGNLFRTIGLAEPTAAKMSVRLVGLAADLASFSNTDPQIALEALQSGLVGLTRPLRQFGINLDVASEKQKAMDLGLYSGKGNLTASARAQAAYALILEQSNLAQGDFARTSGNLAQQQKVLSARFDDAKASLGEALLPAAKTSVLVFNDLFKVFAALPDPLQEAVVGFGALKVATSLFGSQIAGGLAVAKGAGGNIAAGLGFTKQSEAAIASNQEAFVKLTATRAEDSLAIITQQAESDALAASMLATGATLEEVTIAEAELAAGAQAAAAAEGEMAVAGAAASVSLLAIAAPIAVAIGLYKGLHDAITGAGTSFKLNGDAATKLLGDTNAELLKNAGIIDAVGGGKSGFVKLGEQNIKVLYAMRDAAKAQGVTLPNLNAAIKEVETTTARATARDKKYGDTKKDTTDSIKAQSAAEADSLKYKQAVIDASQSQVDKAKDLYGAKVAEQGTSVALVKAIADEAKARRAAAGDSDEYRAALDTIASDQKAETAAAKDTRQAVVALTDAREQARRGLRDERLEKERSVIADERSRLALEDSRDALTKVQDDPRATDRQKVQAALDLRSAELDVQDAQNKRVDTTADLAKAEAAGIEGSDAVVAARGRVATSLDAQGRAEKQTATDTKAAAKVLTDAKDRVADASDKVRDAVFAEAEQQEKIATLAYGAAAGNDAFNASLGRSAQLLDPNSPFVKSLSIYQQVLAGLAGNVDSLISPVPTPADPARPPARDPDSGPRLTKIPGLANLKGPASGGVIDNSKHVTVNTNNGPSAQQVLDELAFGGN